MTGVQSVSDCDNLTDFVGQCSKWKAVAQMSHDCQEIFCEISITAAERAYVAFHEHRDVPSLCCRSHRRKTAACL